MKALARYLTEKYIYIDFLAIYFSYTRRKTSTLSGGNHFINTILSHEGQLGRLGCKGCDGV